MLWEYRVVNLPLDEFSAEERLNALGLERWELVTVDDGMAYLKRFRVMHDEPRRA